MSLITLRNLTVSFGGPALLDRIDLTIEPGERLCLVGRNGTGKSTLLKLLNGEIEPDGGEFSRRQGLKVSRLTQEVPHDLAGPVFDVIAGGMGEVGSLLAEYHDVSHALAESADETLLSRLERLQHDLEAKDGWQLNQRVETVISRLNLPGEEEFGKLSGGLKRRVLLARALVAEPDLLLLDEPTNHLDIEAISWLEEFFLGWGGTLLFITHDRQFLRRLATRIIELDRGQLTSWPGNYDTYLERKQAVLEAEAQQNALFDKKLAQEEVWIRQGIKARRTRNEGRVRALKALRDEFRQRRECMGTARMQVQGGEQSGKLVVEALGITHSYDNKPLIRNLDVTIMRGDRIGILGPNGVGKTTLLRILLGQLQPDAGSVRLGTRLEPVYFDQHRAQLDEEATVLDNLAEGSDKVIINGQPKHVMGYLQDFLFSPERVRSPVKSLSGGERNRLLLAKLFSKPSNLLILDEPTNDLDVETLELLEELLLDYQGTLLLVSHDRAFINNVVSSSLVFEGDGTVNAYVGGYDDWLRQRQVATDSALVREKAKSAPVANTPEKSVKKPAKLSYKEQRELDDLPRHIESLESEQSELLERMGDPAFYQQDSQVIGEGNARLESLEAELADAYERWEALEERRG